MKILLVSEEEQLQFMKNVFIRDLEKVEIIEAIRGLDAIKLAKRYYPEFIFIDIGLPNENGLELATLIQQLDLQTNIILIGNDERYALDAFRIRAFYYLLQPLTREDMTVLIDLIQKEYNQKRYSALRKLPIETNEGISYIAPSEIIYISKNKENKTVSIHTKEEMYLSTYTLQDLEQKLLSYHFLRVHKSYLMNLIYVKELRPYYNGTYNIYSSIFPDDPIPVSRNYIRILRKNLEV
jgi:two-component system response regulator LytT